MPRTVMLGIMYSHLGLFPPEVILEDQDADEERPPHLRDPWQDLHLNKMRDRQQSRHQQARLPQVGWRKRR